MTLSVIFWTLYTGTVLSGFVGMGARQYIARRICLGSALCFFSFLVYCAVTR